MSAYDNQRPETSQTGFHPDYAAAGGTAVMAAADPKGATE
jgi:murein DD-endopeptidase MepM/ murein hydrolase activator NlpD